MQVRVENVFGMEGSSSKDGCGGGFGMDSEHCNVSRELTDSLDMYHHPSTGQILSTIGAPCFPTCWSLWKESRGSKID